MRFHKQTAQVFKISSTFYLGFSREKFERCFRVLNVSAGSITLWPLVERVWPKAWTRTCAYTFSILLSGLSSPPHRTPIRRIWRHCGYRNFLVSRRLRFVRCRHWVRISCGKRTGDNAGGQAARRADGRVQRSGSSRDWRLPPYLRILECDICNSRGKPGFYREVSPATRIQSGEKPTSCNMQHERRKCKTLKQSTAFSVRVICSMLYLR